jgi:transposase
LLGILIKLDDNSPSKNDRKDPKTIAMLVKDGRYREVYIPEDYIRNCGKQYLQYVRGLSPDILQVSS